MKMLSVIYFSREVHDVNKYVVKCFLKVKALDYYYVGFKSID